MSAFKQPFGLLVKSALPYIGLMLLCLALVTWQPWIAMYLVDGELPLTGGPGGPPETPRDRP